MPTIFPTARQGVRRRDRATRSSGAVGGYGDALERGAVPQQPGSLRPQGRLHDGLRQALRQGRRRSSASTRRTRTSSGYGSGENSAVLGCGRPATGGARRPATSWPTSCSRTWPGASPRSRLSARCRSAGATSSSTSPTRGRSARASRWTTACATRCFYNPYADDDKIIELRAGRRSTPALGADRVQRPAACRPDTDCCQPAGAQGGADGPNRSLMNQDYEQLRAAPRRRLGRVRRRQDRGARRPRAVLPARAPEPRPATSRGNPPFVKTISGIRYARLGRRSPATAASATSLGTPTRGREVDQVTPNNWQWNLTMQHEIWQNTTLEVGYVGNNGYNLLRNRDEQPGPARRHQPQRRRRPPRLRAVGRRRLPGVGEAVRPFSVCGEHQHHDLGSQRRVRRTTRCRRSSSAGSARSQFQASYTLSRSRANLALDDSERRPERGSGAARRDRTPTSTGAGRRRTGRTSSTPSLILMLPSLEERVAVTRVSRRLGDRDDRRAASTGQPLTVFTDRVPGLPRRSVRDGLHATTSGRTARACRARRAAA